MAIKENKEFQRWAAAWLNTTTDEVQSRTRTIACWSDRHTAGSTTPGDRDVWTYVIPAGLSIEQADREDRIKRVAEVILGDANSSWSGGQAKKYE